MTQDDFNKKFEELYEAYSSKQYNEKEQLNLLFELFYSDRPDKYYQDEMKKLHETFMLHVDLETRASFFTEFRRMYNANNWEADYQDDLSDEEYDYIFMRDTNVLVLYYLFCSYSLIVNPINVPITARMAKKRAKLRRDELLDKCINHISDELFLCLNHCIDDIIA